MKNQKIFMEIEIIGESVLYSRWEEMGHTGTISTLPIYNKSRMDNKSVKGV